MHLEFTDFIYYPDYNNNDDLQRELILMIIIL